MLRGMRPRGTSEQLEKRRREAIALVKAGHSHRSIATRLKSSLSSVVRWLQAYRTEGLKGLRSRPTPGRPPGLSKSQKQKLQRILVRGALSEGYSTDLWTLKRIAKAIERHFAVRYHPGHVWWLMVALGWSCQKPERRALERDEKAIANWKRRNWPRIKKTERLKAHLAFLDESGFLPIPNVRRSWAPLGQTPIVRHRYKRDRISAICALTVSSNRKRLGLYINFHTINITGVEVIGFLRHLLRHLKGDVVLLWDGGFIHRRVIVKDFIEQHRRLHVFRFPAYAPEINPAEFVWSKAKCALSNSAPDDLRELGTLLRRSIGRIRGSKQLLHSCPWRILNFIIIMPPWVFGTGPDNATSIGKHRGVHLQEQDDPPFQKGFLRSTRNEPGIHYNRF